MKRRRRWRRWGLGFGAVVLIVYILFVFGPGADWVIIGPRPGRVDAGSARREVVRVNGKAVEAWVARSPAVAQGREPDGYVLEFPGSATRAENIAQYVAQRWEQQPVEAWVINYPGVGGSEGSVKLKNIAPAALGVFDDLRRRGPGKPIFVEANSLGTAAALCVAANRDVAGCVLHDPVPLKQLILGKYGWWNLWLAAGPVAWQVPDALDSVENAKRSKAPAVFIIATKDSYILAKYHDLVTEAYCAEKRFVLLPGDHWDSVTGDAEKQLREEIARLWAKAQRP